MYEARLVRRRSSTHGTVSSLRCNPKYRIKIATHTSGIAAGSSNAISAPDSALEPEQRVVPIPPKRRRTTPSLGSRSSHPSDTMANQFNVDGVSNGTFDAPIIIRRM